MSREDLHVGEVNDRTGVVFAGDVVGDGRGVLVVDGAEDVVHGEEVDENVGGSVSQADAERLRARDAGGDAGGALSGALGSLGAETTRESLGDAARGRAGGVDVARGRVVGRSARRDAPRERRRVSRGGPGGEAARDVGARAEARCSRIVRM